ncbi:MAG TPA: hypothetical protein VJ810_32635 [Blastocatellia bacterium]|nr:hypothetical protein [Blastocatellia bacterium]
MMHPIFRTSALALCFLMALCYGFLIAARRNTASAQPPTFRISQVLLPANDLVYHAPSNTVFASVPSAAGTSGNTITGIDPVTGEIVSSVFIGSEPNQLALSDDGNSIYVALDGAATVRRYEIATRTAGQQFSLGKTQSDGPFYAGELAVAPGQNETVIVSRRTIGSSNTLTVFDAAAPRPNAVNSFNGGFLIEPVNGGTILAYENGPFSGLRLLRLSLDGAGLSVAQSVNNLPNLGGGIEFSSGLLYTSSGKVINPDNLTVAGDIGDQGAGALLTADANAGRVFYLTGSGAVRTLRAFNLSTLNSRGALDIPGVNGSAGSLIRWGANGFAFRTSGGQVFLIQTLLVPSSEPIPPSGPTPTPTPAPTPAASFAQAFSLSAKDIIYDPDRSVIYASVSSASPEYGNSVVSIDPALGRIMAGDFVGSEPGKLALSGDGQYLYVALDGAGSVRRINLRDSQRPRESLLIYLGNNRDTGPYIVNDMDAAPGAPAKFAVARFSPPNFAPRSQGAALIDNDRPLPNVGSSFTGAVEFAESGAILYESGFESSGGLTKYAVNENGLERIYNEAGLVGGDIKFSQGLLYASNGQVCDPETQSLKGRFNASGAVLPDAARGRIYFLTGTSGPRALRAFDLDTFTPLGVVNISGVNGAVNRLIRWGANGLAFVTSAGQLFLIQTSLVSSDPILTPTPPPLPTPTATPLTTQIRQITIAANDLVFDSAGQTIYASVGSQGGPRANTIMPINPATGALGASVAIGPEPDKLALSSDNRYIYAYLMPPNPAVRRFDIATQTAGQQFPSGGLTDLEVLPGQAGAVAAADGNSQVTIYDDGAPRPNRAIFPGSISKIEFGAAATSLYGYNDVSTGFDFYRMRVNDTGVSLIPDSQVRNLITGFNVTLRFASGLLYASSGRAIDPEKGRLVGTFPITAQTLAVDAANNRIFFVTNFSEDGQFPAQLTAFDLRTFLPAGQVSIPGVLGQATSLLRWGANGFAFRTTRNQVFLIQTSLVPNAGGNFPAPPANVSAASFAPGPIARDSIVSAFGVNLADTTQAAASLPLPTTLAGARVSARDIFGSESNLPLFFASPQQINYHLPAFIQPGQRSFNFVGANGFVFSAPITVVDVAPGLFAANANGQGVAAAVALRVKADGSQSFEPVAVFDQSQNKFVALPIDLGPDLGSASDQVFLILFGTGFRNRRSLSTVVARIGGENAEVLFAGAQGGFVGLDQMNVRLPRALAGRGKVEIVMTVDGKPANTIEISVK